MADTSTQTNIILRTLLAHLIELHGRDRAAELLTGMAAQLQRLAN